jgi:cytochrome b6
MATTRDRLGTVGRWLDEHAGLEDLKALGRHKLVPRHRHSIWYYLGGMTLFLFGIQVATGILLTLYYRPSPDEAYESVRFITGEVSFGWLIRALHGWTANLLVLVAILHLASVFFLKAYRKPREVTWMTGTLLLFVFLGFGFSGYLLPWNELSFFATRVGTQIAGVIPVVGDFLLRLLRGGEDVTGATLSRFYGVHIAVLPAAATALLGLHLFLVQKHGMSVPLSVEREKAPPPTMPFLPNFLLRDLVGWLAVLGLLAGLAALLPEGDGFFVKLELGHKADPLGSAPAGLKPEWYFLAMFYTLKLLPAHLMGIDWLEGEQVGVLVFSFLGLLFVLVPFLDRKSARGERSRWLTGIGIAALIYVVVFTILGRVMD